MPFTRFIGFGGRHEDLQCLYDTFCLLLTHQSDYNRTMDKHSPSPIQQCQALLAAKGWQFMVPTGAIGTDLLAVGPDRQIYAVRYQPYPAMTRSDRYAFALAQSLYGADRALWIGSSIRLPAWDRWTPEVCEPDTIPGGAQGECQKIRELPFPITPRAVVRRLALQGWTLRLSRLKVWVGKTPWGEDIVLNIQAWCRDLTIDDLATAKKLAATRAVVCLSQYPASALVGMAARRYTVALAVPKASSI